jgi:Tfp pilus assembly protein PilX
MKATLKNERGISLVVILMVMTVLLTVIGAGLLLSGVNTKVAMNYRTGTKAFNAADVGINAIAAAIAPNTTPSSTPVSLGNSLCYRFGKRDGTVPTLTPTVTSGEGYSLGSGTGYNTSGYSFYQYQVNVTGTYSTGSNCPSVGNETAAREVEALALYGPVAQ